MKSEAQTTIIPSPFAPGIKPVTTPFKHSGVVAILSATTKGILLSATLPQPSLTDTNRSCFPSGKFFNFTLPVAKESVVILVFAAKVQSDWKVIGAATAVP